MLTENDCYNRQVTEPLTPPFSSVPETVLSQSEPSIPHKSSGMRQRWQHWQQRLSDWRQRVWSPKGTFAAPDKVVTIANMELNLTALWEGLSWPVRAGWRTLSRVMGGGRARSRRRKLSAAEAAVQRVKLLRLAALVGLGCVLLGILLFFGLLAWFSRELPQPGKIVRREGFSTVITDRNGQVLYDLSGDERRVPVSISQMPETLKQATVAIEDKDFYRHRGFDFMTILRIPYNIVVRQRVIGGSTLTQQLVKNVLLTSERTVTRKFKEFVIALQIERKFSKDQILEMYLNEAPFGGTAWGVGAASELYFNKSVSELSLVESAFLAGLPQRPSAYSPFIGQTNADGQPLWKIRTQSVLAAMLRDGYITDLGYEQALGDLDTMTFQQQSFDIKAPHFVFYVEKQLNEMYGEDILSKGGLRVTTTLDLDLQDQAQTIVQEEIEKVQSQKISNGAAMVMDPRTGEILTMVGSVDYFSEDIDGQFNVAVDGLRQPGSSIKPVTYLSMIQQGYTPAYMFADVETTFAPDDTADPYEPKNYDGKFRGPVSLRNSLGSSLNIPAVKGLALVGLDHFLQQAYDMGFVTLEPTQDNMRRFGLAVTLGGAEVHLLDTVSAYSSFANGGTRVEPVSILKVSDLDGRTLYEHKPVVGREVMQPEEAFLINNILSDDTARQMAFGLGSKLNVSPNVAVKTGTTNDQRDNWCIGWSREIVVGAWVGNNDNSPMAQVTSGISGATPIWRRIIDATLELDAYSAPDWEVPDGVEQVEVDAISGYPSHDGYASRQEWVIKGTLPNLPDPIHTKLRVCKGQNKLATDAQVGAGDYDEKEFVVMAEDDPVSRDGRNRWQEAITNWINGQPDEKYKFPTEYCGDTNEVFVTLSEPGNEQNLDGEDIKVEIRAESGRGIEKIELVVNGSVRETINNNDYEGTVKLSRGRYELWAVAYSRDGQKKESGHVRIGTGGETWNVPPSPSPVPSPVPSPTPAASPSPSPSPVVSPSPSPATSPTPSPSP